MQITPFNDGLCIGTALKCYSCTSYEDILNIQFLDEFPRCSTEEGANNGFYGDLKSCATPDTTCFKGIYSNFIIYPSKTNAFIIFCINTTTI